MTQKAEGIFGLTGFQRDVLVEIADHDTAPSGQQIRRSIESDEDVNVNHGRLYPNLDTLVDRDLVVKGSIDQRTNCYQLTPKGASVLEGRRDELNEIDIEPHVEAVKQDTPRDIVDEWLGTDRDLGDVLDAVHDEDNVLDVHRHLGATRVSRTRRLLQELKLVDSTGDLLTGDDLNARSAELEEFVETPVAAADGGEI